MTGEYDFSKPREWTGTAALEAMSAGFPPGHYGEDTPPRVGPPAVVTAIDAERGTITVSSAPPRSWRSSFAYNLLTAILALRR